MSGVNKIILSMRQKVIRGFMEDGDLAKDKRYLSWVMVTLVSLASDFHKSIGGSKESFIQFAAGVFDYQSSPVNEPGEPSPSTPPKRVIN